MPITSTCCSRLAAKQEEAADSRSASPGSVSLQQKGLDPRTPPTPDVRLYHRAVVVAQVPLATQFCIVSSDMLYRDSKRGNPQ